MTDIYHVDGAWTDQTPAGRPSCAPCAQGTRASCSTTCGSPRSAG